MAAIAEILFLLFMCRFGNVYSILQIGLLRFHINYGRRENQMRLKCVFAVIGVLYFFIRFEEGRRLSSLFALCH